MTRTRSFLTSLLAPGLLLLVSSAQAGNLAETARAVDNKSSAESRSSSSSDNNDDDNDDDSFGFRDSEYGGCLLCNNQDQLTQIYLPPPDFDLRLSAQKVIDSDGSFHLDAAMNIGRLGILASADHYYEEIVASGKMAERSEDVRINLAELSIFARLAETEMVQADLRVGFALATSSHFDTLPGGVAGIRLLARANKHIAISAEARAMRYSHEISAVEALTGAQISHVWLGYRALKFDVGPVLEGPEAGVRFHF